MEISCSRIQVTVLLIGIIATSSGIKMTKSNTKESVDSEADVAKRREEAELISKENARQFGEILQTISGWKWRDGNRTKMMT